MFGLAYFQAAIFAQPSAVIVTTLAGSGSDGYGDGAGTGASFNWPTGVAVDSSFNVYVADSDNHKIRKITPGGVVTTLAGSGSSGSADGTGTLASFSYPKGVAVDTERNVYVADTNNSKIRKITSAGVVTTLAGSGSRGSSDGTGAAADFFYPWGVAVDNNGNVYVADSNNHKIRKITPQGVVTTLVGSGSSGSSDGTGTLASFSYLKGVTVDNRGNIYLTDNVVDNNAKIRKITPEGVVTTLASIGISIGIAVDGIGNLFVTSSNNKIIRITPEGAETTLAGSGSPGSSDGTGTIASFSYPKGVAVDTAGNVYVADTENSKIRKITPTPVALPPVPSGGEGVSAPSGGDGGSPAAKKPSKKKPGSAKKSTSKKSGPKKKPAGGKKTCGPTPEGQTMADAYHKRGGRRSFPALP
jgi:sugar lactone lactonase YvrE